MTAKGRGGWTGSKKENEAPLALAANKPAHPIAKRFCGKRM
jgi:hypothetical protein